MNHKLIFVEGLPGTGKTTLSEYIFNLLINHGIKTELLLEDNAKIPSNFRDIAGIPKSININVPFDNCQVIETGNYFYVNIRNCDEKSATLLTQYDIGDEFNKLVSVQEYMRCTLEWWRYWTEESIRDSVLVLDSAFMQCPINEMIFRGASDSEIMEYIRRIAETIKPYNPICIYLRRESADIAINFAKVVKGEVWAKGLDGLEKIGCTNLFERRFTLENTLISEAPSIVCTITDFDWSDAITKVKSLI